MPPKGGFLPIVGRPALLMEGRGRRGARMSLDSSWFDLDRDAIVARLLTFGCSRAEAEREAASFLDYRAKLRERPTPEPEAEAAVDEVALEWQQSLRRRQSGE